MVNTLQTVYTLYFLDHIILNSTDTLDLQNVMRIHAAFCQLITSLQKLTVLNLNTGTVGDQVSLGIAILIVCDNDLIA